MNSPDDLGVARRLPNLPELQARARAINTRLLNCLIVAPDTNLRWRRDLIRRRHADASRPREP